MSVISSPHSSQPHYLLQHLCTLHPQCVVERPLSELALKTINDHTLREDEDSSGITAFILATGGMHGELLLRRTSATTTEKLAISDIFPNGAISYRIPNMPYTRRKGYCDWRLYISADKAPSPINLAVDSHFGQEWFGNILLMKYKSDDCTTLESVHTNDQVLAYHILTAWFYEFSRMREHRPEYQIHGSSSIRSAGFNVLFSKSSEFLDP